MSAVRVSQRDQRWKRARFRNIPNGLGPHVAPREHWSAVTDCFLLSFLPFGKGGNRWNYYFNSLSSSLSLSLSLTLPHRFALSLARFSMSCWHPVQPISVKVGGFFSLHQHDVSSTVSKIVSYSMRSFLLPSIYFAQALGTSLASVPVQPKAMFTRAIIFMP